MLGRRPQAGAYRHRSTTLLACGTRRSYGGAHSLHRTRHQPRPAAAADRVAGTGTAEDPVAAAPPSRHRRSLTPRRLPVAARRGRRRVVGLRRQGPPPASGRQPTRRAGETPRAAVGPKRLPGHGRRQDKSGSAWRGDRDVGSILRTAMSARCHCAGAWVSLGFTVLRQRRAGLPGYSGGRLDRMSTTQRPRVLVVDDDPALRDLRADYLAPAASRSMPSRDGAAMHERLALGNARRAGADIMLPGADGLSLARELRRHSDLPILMLGTRRRDRPGGRAEVGADVTRAVLQAARAAGAVRTAGRAMRHGARRRGRGLPGPRLRAVQGSTPPPGGCARRREVPTTPGEYDLLRVSSSIRTGCSRDDPSPGSGATSVTPSTAASTYG